MTIKEKCKFVREVILEVCPHSGGICVDWVPPYCDHVAVNYRCEKCDRIYQPHDLVKKTLQECVTQLWWEDFAEWSTLRYPSARFTDHDPERTLDWIIEYYQSGRDLWEKIHENSI